jgi:hypothetical protein
VALRKKRFFCLFACLLLCWVGVHSGIYPGSCNISNISYLNSATHHPPLSFILPLPTPFLEQFQRVLFFHLHTCVHTFCIVFTLLPHFPATSPTPQVLIPVLPPNRTYSLLLFFDFVDERREKIKRKTWHFSYF